MDNTIRTRKDYQDLFGNARKACWNYNPSIWVDRAPKPVFTNTHASNHFTFYISPAKSFL